GPDAMIGVGLDLFLAAAELVALLAFALLLPFVHLDLAHQAERIGGDAKLLVGERRARRKIAAHIDELTVVRRINARRAHLLDRVTALSERARGRDGPALVPEQQYDGGDDQNDTDQHAENRFAEAGDPRRGRHLGKRIAWIRHSSPD